MASFGPVLSLTRLQALEPGVRADRLGAFINRLAEPRTTKRLLIGGVLAVVLAPLVLEGGRRLLLHWKMPDLQAYLHAEELDRKKQAMYRVLGRQGSSMTKTLSDLACCAPDGIEIEFINIAGSAKGQSVTVRGKARPAGNLQGSEVMLEMEKDLRESGAFEAIQRSSEAPDARGYQEFTLNATAVRPTYTVAFPEAQDFAKLTMRERRYGPPPEDVDTAASGTEVAVDGGAKGTGGKAGSKTASKPSDAKSTTAKGTGEGTSADTKSGSTSKSETKSAAAPAPSKVAAAPAPSTKTGSSTSSSKSAATKTADAAADGADAAAGSDAAKPSSRGSGSGSRGLAKRGTPGGSAEPDPPPAPLSENEINRMSKEEARDALVKISKARQRADLDDPTQARLKNEFNLLLERCKRD